MENIIKEIIITKNTLITEIQKDFNVFYPFLKIEFSTNAKKFLSLKKYEINPESRISKITNLANTIQLNVDEERTVAEVEEDCKKLLGLSMQVFRKSGNVWNAISLTESWTLKSQNTAGEFISIEMASSA